MILTLLLSYWRVAVVGLVVAAVGGYVWHCTNAQRSWAEAKAIGQRQEAENARQALRDLKNKERSDENYQRNMARLAADVKRLRGNASRRYVPAAPASTGTASLACYDRDSLDLAIRTFVTGLLGIVEQGATAVEGLDEAREWARER